MTRSSPAGGRRGLPVLYYRFAHLALFAACILLAAAPRAVAGFHYHPRMVAVVHLVTLGWISASIVGSLYMLGPMTLGVLRTRGRGDVAAFWVYAVGVAGMTTHFWIDEASGMVWSAGMVLASLTWVAGRVLADLPAARLPAAVRLHLTLAFGNLALAGTLGLLAGLDKLTPVLPGHPLANAYAHAHLAALGWVLMLVMGVAYRLLPMLLPSAVAQGSLLVAGALTLELGALGLSASLLARSWWAAPFGVVVLTAIVIFLSRVVWMLGRRRPPGPALPRPDHAVGLMLGGFVSLVLTALLGAALLLAPVGPWQLRAATAYGTLGLLGFFGQLIAGAGLRLVPFWAYLGSATRSGCSRSAPPPRELVSPRLELWVRRLWWTSLPLLCLALTFEWIPWLRLAAVLLGAAVVLGATAQTRALRRALSGSGAGSRS